MSDSAMSDVPPPADSAAAPAAAPAPTPAAAAAPSSAPAPISAPPAPAAAPAPTTNTDLKRKLDDGAAAQPAAEDGAQPAEKKMKTENGTPATATSTPAASASTPSTSTSAPSAAPSSSSAPTPAPSAASTIPKKAGIPKKTGVVGAVGGPKPLPKPISAPVPAPKPVAVAVSAAPGNVPKPAAASPPAASPTKGPAPKPAAASKSASKKEEEDSDSSSSESDSSSDSDSEDDRPLQKKKPAAKRAPARKPASATKKRKKQDSDSDSSSSSDSDSDSSSSSDSDSSDSSDSSDDSDSSSSSSSDSDSSASDSSTGVRRKRGVKKAPARRKPAGKKNTNATASRYTKARRPRGDDESGSDSEEEEGFDESKVVLYPMTKYQLKENVEPLKETQGANKWWNRMQDTEDRTKWVSLDHNGMLFPPPYQPHDIPLLYDGAEVILNPEQEEVASMWAAMLETDYVKNKTFQKNFFRDFKALFPKESVVKELDKCDFSRMAAHITSEKETAKLLRKTDPKVRAADKEEKDRLQEIYGYALVDGYKEKVGNFRVEPPNLFRGRGDHPKTGTLKRRVQPEDVIINIGMGMAIPPPPPGRSWRGIIHNNKVTWLAFYRDNVNGDFKYIWLAPSSRFKGESDIKKYTKAQKLKKYIDEIRKNYRKEMKSPHSQFRQRATAIYLIDFLALRVGNEKDKNEVADTVGCCSLRVEHLSFSDNNTVTFDFLGKDSMRYYNTVELDEQAYKNLKSFCEKKKPKDEVFGDLTTSLLNEHLKSLMPDLTAKVFRTYNASVTLEQELNKNDVSPDEHITTKVNYYNAANREVAILCNHQKTVSKGHESAIGKLKEQLEALYDDRDEMVDWIEELTETKKGKKDAKAAREHRANERAERRKHRLQKARDAAKAKKEKAKEERAKLRAAGKEIPPSDQEEEDEEYGVKEKVKPKPTTVKQAETALTRLKERIVNFEAKLTLRDQNKEVALGTSKINYMDPRITVAWCKRKEVPLEMVFNKSLVTKFPWAMEVPADWKF